MARVTVEDCIDKVEDSFELVLLAAHRARCLSGGASLTVQRDRDKNPVVALREIAEATLSPEDLREELIQSRQRHVEVDEAEDMAEDPFTSAEGEEHKRGTDQANLEEELLKCLESLVPPSEMPSEF